MGIQITFDTAFLKPDEAAGLMALLATVSPSAINVLEQGGKTAAPVIIPASVERPAPTVADVLAARQAVAELPPKTEEELAAEENGYDANAVFPAPVLPEGDPRLAQSQERAAAEADPVTLYAQAGGTMPDTDKTGLPWDARIHSTPATKKNDGTWRAKRGVGNDLVEKVTAELRAGAPRPITPVAPIATAAAPLAPPPPATSDSVTAAPTATPAPPASTPQVPAPPSAAPAPATENAPQAFARVIQKMNKAQTAGKLTVVDVSQACEAVGVKEARGLLGLGAGALEAILTFDALIDAAVQAAG